MQEFALLGIVLVLGLGAYWSLVIFPRQRDFQKQQKYVSTLNVGDEMVTFGGIIGRVMTVEPEKGIATIEIADGVIIRVLAASLMRPYDPEELALSAELGSREKNKIQQ
ncbi:MAG: preprotein translocase subunit YajC [Chloroflexota bacterium]